MQKDRLLILSNHYRRSAFFEDTIRLLYDAGYQNVWIQDTGHETWGPYQGPSRIYDKPGHYTYDSGMVNLKNQIPRGSGPCDVILFIDNDCFLNNLDNFQTYLQEFLDGGYDYACHFAHPCYYKNYRFEGKEILPVNNQTFHPSDDKPGFAPDPHWENAYMLIAKSTWDALTPQEMSHGRLWTRGLVRTGARLGTHSCKYKLSFSHFGPGWFHVGNLMGTHIALEKMIKVERKFNPESRMNMARLGYFIVQRDIYGKDIYPKYINGNLNQIIKMVGGRQIAIDAWEQLVSGTCMEHWEKLS